MQGCLTEKQQRIWCLLKEGYTRKEMASYLMISEQAVHQIRRELREPKWIETFRGIGYKLVVQA